MANQNAKAKTKAFELYLKDHGIESIESNKKLRKFKHSGAWSRSITSGLATMGKNHIE